MHTYNGKVQLKSGSVVNLVGARLGDAEAELWVVEEAGKTTLVSTRTSTLLVPASLRNDIFKSCQFWSSLKKNLKAGLLPLHPGLPLLRLRLWMADGEVGEALGEVLVLHPPLSHPRHQLLFLLH